MEPRRNGIAAVPQRPLQAEDAGRDLPADPPRPEPGRIDDQQWKSIVDALPDLLRVRARRRAPHYRSFVEGVLWVIGEDAYWGELPQRFGSWRAVYVRFLRWNNMEVWGKVADILGREEALARGLLARAARHTAIASKRYRRKYPGEGQAK